MRKTIARLLIKLADCIEPFTATSCRGGLANRGKKTSAVHKRHLRESQIGRTYRSRFKHAPVDLAEAQRLYETGCSINDIVVAVKGTRHPFDVKKLVRKTFRNSGILKPQDAPYSGRPLHKADLVDVVEGTAS
jgi:hypothetical protein